MDLRFGREVNMNMENLKDQKVHNRGQELMFRNYEDNDMKREKKQITGFYRKGKGEK